MTEQQGSVLNSLPTEITVEKKGEKKGDKKSTAKDLLEKVSEISSFVFFNFSLETAICLDCDCAASQLG